MSKAYSIDPRELAMARLECGETAREVAAALRVAASSVIKRAARKRLSGSIAPGKMGGHRPHLISGDHRLFVLGEVARDPNVTRYWVEAPFDTWAVDEAIPSVSPHPEHVKLAVSAERIHVLSH